ncbi:MAG: type I methionyl aminopeptidase [Thermoanaerobaculia bacterium]|nr:type I methionyl aminopeptidase [Thermoanaerobaculia bacterium]
MTIESDAELQGIREAGRVVARTLNTLVPRVRPGVTTAELDRAALALLEQEGARSAPALEYGFPATVCISVNDEIVHGIPGRRVLRAGDLVTVDVTAEKDGFVADAARTVVVAHPSRAKRRLVRCARAAFAEAMRVARAGYRVRDIGAAIERTVERFGLTVIRDLHGHGVGRRIHEDPTVPGYYDAANDRPLEPGLVLAIEPLVSAGSGFTRLLADGWTVSTRDGSLSAHHENTVVVTAGPPLVVTAG